MRVLVACEESQEVCKAFRARGHEAYSCDIQPCSGGHPEWHLQVDALELLKMEWDLIIAHPPCTYLSVAGNQCFNIQRFGEKAKERERERERAAEFFLAFAQANCPRIAIENPVGYMNTHWRKADQIIDPYMFAKGTDDIENYQRKRTCLWLKGLDMLKGNCLPPPKPVYYRTTKDGKRKAVYFTENHGKIDGQKHGGNDAAARSKTFPGIAKAMAEQWG